MKLKSTKSLFKDGTPFLEIVEPFVMSDFTSEERKPKANVEDALKRDAIFRNIEGSVYLFPKDEIIEELLNHGFKGGKGVRNLDDEIRYFFRLDDYGITKDRYYQYRNESGKQIQFRGIRSQEGKHKKYMKSYDDFINNFDDNKDGHFESIIKDLNVTLERQVKAKNKRYEEVHMELFTTTTYEDSFKKEFNEEPRFEELSSVKSKLAEKLSKLNDKLEEIKQEELNLKIDIMKKQVSSHDVAPSVKEDIMKKLNSGDAWKPKGRWRGFS